MHANWAPSACQQQSRALDARYLLDEQKRICVDMHPAAVCCRNLDCAGNGQCYKKLAVSELSLRRDDSKAASFMAQLVCRVYVIVRLVPCNVLL